ncbi:hypothetical protein F4679DRAFT_540056 [Xylaria curta]|nr:hypothetical protein F4679DRAFT_540056 [Xylaria curta]
MSYPSPRQTPERQCQRLVEREPSPEPSPSTPTKKRALAVLSSPVSFLRGLGHPTTPSPSILSPRRSRHPYFQEEEDHGGESQGTTSSIDTSESGDEESHRRSLYKRALAPLRNSRQRQRARLCRVNRLISFIEKLNNEGYLGSKEAIPKKLLPREYIELLLEVEKRDSDFQNYFKHSLRYEYRESRYGKNQFTIFMLSAFHIRMQGLIDNEVARWSARVKDNDENAVEVKTAAEKIRPGRDTSIETKNKSIRPDCSFSYLGSGSYPSVAFEIAWSQGAEDLKKRAMELIQESAGEIRTVVGMDFSETHSIWARIQDNVGTGEFPNRGPATAFIWRAMFDENGQQIYNADGQPRIQKKNYRFCDDDGTPQQRAKIQLSLKEFVPLQVILEEGWDTVETLDNTKLEFDSAMIVQYFGEALEVQKIEDERKRPKREKMAREKIEIRQEQEAKRRAAIERERSQRSLLDFVNIGGHSLRRRARQN